MEDYFTRMQEEVNLCYNIAEKARLKGLDPEIYVESPQARDLAGRVEKLVGPDGVAASIRKLKKKDIRKMKSFFKLFLTYWKKKLEILNLSNRELKEQ